MEKNKIISIAVVVVMVAASMGGVAWFLKNTPSSDVKLGNVTLPMFGNADENGTIDSADVEYIKGVIAGTKTNNAMCDANQDGKVDNEDVALVEKIMKKQKCKIFYTNVDGKVASVNIPVKKTIVAYSNNVEVMKVLKKTDTMIGVDDSVKVYKNLMPEVQDLPSIGSRMTMNVEKILELKPDIVFTGTTQWYTPDLEEKLAGTNTEVIRLPTWEYNHISSTVLLMGYIMDAVGNAQKYVTWSNNILDQIKSVTSIMPESEKKRVFADRSIVKPDTSVGISSGYAEVMEMAGAINLAKGLPGGSYPVVSKEWVNSQNPEQYIVIGKFGSYESNDFSSMNAGIADVKTKFAFTKGVIDNKINALHYDIFLGVSYVIGLSYMAKWFHPDKFQNLDPLKFHKELIDNFYDGVKFDPATQGAFVI